MFTSLELFRTAHAMASHAGARQTVVATNIANADTPGYRARDIAPFADTFENVGASGMRASRAGHLSAGNGPAQFAPVADTSAEVSPNGNSVSLEFEMVKAVDVQRQHKRAIAIYGTGLSILRTSLGRR